MRIEEFLTLQHCNTSSHDKMCFETVVYRGESGGATVHKLSLVSGYLGKRCVMLIKIRRFGET